MMTTAKSPERDAWGVPDAESAPIKGGWGASGGDDATTNKDDMDHDRKLAMDQPQSPPPANASSGGRDLRPSGGSGRFRENPEPTNVLGVFGLSLRTSEADLRDIFGKFGPIEKLTVVMDKRTNVSRGFAFITFEKVEDADEARKATTDSIVDERRIRVDFSVTKKPHDPTPGQYMGPRRDDYSGSGAGGPKKRDLPPPPPPSYGSFDRYGPPPPRSFDRYGPPPPRFDGPPRGGRYDDRGYPPPPPPPHMRDLPPYDRPMYGRRNDRYPGPPPPPPHMRDYYDMPPPPRRGPPGPGYGMPLPPPSRRRSPPPPLSPRGAPRYDAPPPPSGSGGASRRSPSPAGYQMHPDRMRAQQRSRSPPGGYRR
ncbi:hypothetical protein MIR68_008039 [Amoeboaphelidium protococcarum]|nr:hypothetical protein MIR68_008039 [Amoeboaphelidium protococcarum]